MHKTTHTLFLSLLITILCLPLPAQRIGDGFPATGRTFAVENFGEDLMQRLVAADNLVRRYRWEEAVLMYDNVIAQDPFFSDAYVKRALLKYKLGRTSEAQNDIAMAARLNPYAADVYGYNGRSGQLAQLYVPSYEDVTLEADAEMITGYVRRGLQRKAEGDWLGAHQDLEQALALLDQPSPALCNARGNLFLLFGKYNRAIEEYTQAIQLDADNAAAFYNRAIAQILAYNRVSACYDLERSAALGSEMARERLPYFCNQ